MISSFYLTNAINAIIDSLEAKMFFLFITMVIFLVRFDFIRFILDYNFRRASQKIGCKGMVIYILALNLLLKQTAETARRSCWRCKNDRHIAEVYTRGKRLVRRRHFKLWGSYGGMLHQKF